MTGGPSRVSVIVVSWNSERFLPGCLDSIAAQSHPSIELIVVDNGSTDGSVEIVRRRAPGAILIPLGENTGFCRANNAGLARAGGDAILFLNSDIILEPDYVARALTPFGRDERIGSVSGKLLRFDGRTLDSTGQFLTRGRRVIERGYGGADEGRFERAGYIFSVCGAAALYRSSTVEDLSSEGEFFDPDFFAFSEDIDAGWRARNAGWRAFYEPGAVARHYRGGTGAPEGFFSARAAILKRPPPIRTHILINRYLTMIKNDRPGDVLRDLPWIVAREAGLAAVVVACGPRVWTRLAASGPLLSRALARRRRFLATAGVLGPRRCGLPASWTGEGLREEAC